MNIWEEAILKSIESRDSPVDTQDLYSDLESGKFLAMSDNDLRTTIYGGRPAYQHQVRSHLSNLVKAGYLERISRGVYSLTSKGRKRIR